MSDPTPYSRRSPLEHERDEGGMSDDLVLQLRSLAGTHGSTVATPCHAAADRIEALQAEALDWRAQVGELSDKCKALEAEARGRADEFLAFASDHAEWSQATFGSDEHRDWTGPLAHLSKEIEEIAAAPTDPTEWADGLMLLLDGSRRAGIPAKALLETAVAKLAVNKARTWGKPNADGSVEHVRAALTQEGEG